MIGLYFLFLTTYFMSCLRFFSNDWFVYKNVVFRNIFIIYPIAQIFLVNVSPHHNYWLIIPEILINYYIYDFIYYHIHKKIQYHPIHELRHDKHLSAFAAYYSSPIDFILLDIIPMYLGLYLMRANQLTYAYFIFTETHLAVMSHSRRGSRRVFFQNHFYNENCNYGIGLFTDIKYKTYFVN